MRAGAVSMFFLMAVTAGASAQTLVYRVDHATAVIQDGLVAVQAKGAVRSGGWERPRLIVRKTAPGEIRLEFVATPPRNKAAVVQTILPINGKLNIRLSSGSVATIKIVSETNSVTARIVPQQRLANQTGS